MTPDEELKHERQIAQILTIRQSGKEASSGLSVWLNSTVITALVGVLGTGLLGAWVSGLIQDRARNNDLQRAAQEARLASRNKIVSEILTVLGASMSSTDDLLVTVSAAYREKGRSRSDIAAIREWKVELAERRDAADSQWRQQKRSMGYTLRYLYDSEPRVNDAWIGVATNADLFERCTNTWYGENAAQGSTLSVDQICPNERRAFESAVELFMTSVTSKDVTFD